MTVISKSDSTRISLLRFPLIVGVVYIHNYDIYPNTLGRAFGAEWQAWLSQFSIALMAQGIARLAVPIFFILSGYLFYLNYKSNSKDYIPALQKRVSTLLIPFLFWNVLVLLLTIALQAGSNNPALFSGRFKSPLDFTTYEYIDAILGIDRRPIAHHLWFIRDLIILSVLSPVVLALVKRGGLLFIGAIFWLWLLDGWRFPTPSLDGILYFSIGCWLALNQRSLFTLDAHAPYFILSYIPLLLISTAMGEQVTTGRIIHNAGIACGIPVALYLTNLAANSLPLQSALLALAPASFFVYAAHDPAIAMLRKASLMLVPHPSHLVVMGLYFFLPCLLIACLVALHRISSKLAPRFTSLITGGR